VSRHGDTQFLSAIETAESLRIDPTTTRPRLGAMTRIVKRWTNLP
jgi:hypothetical protein